MEYDVGSPASDGKPKRNKIEKRLPEVKMKAFRKERDGECGFIFVVHTTCM
jgi:hypothetical protein